MSEPNAPAQPLSTAAALLGVVSAPPARPASRWAFLRCLATWMPGGSGGLTATGTHIWTHLRNDHD